MLEYVSLLGLTEEYMFMLAFKAITELLIYFNHNYDYPGVLR